MPTLARRHVLRSVAALLAACAAVLLGAAPAAAHTRLQSSDPADGSSVGAAPDAVALTFNEATEAEFATLKVLGPDGTEYQAGAVAADGGRVSTALSPLGPAGVYRIAYRVVSDDGHPVQGAVSFTLTAPGPGAADPAAAAPAPAARASAAPAATPGSTTGGSDGGTPVWPWFVGAAALVASGVVAVLRLGRRSKEPVR